MSQHHSSDVDDPVGAPAGSSCRPPPPRPAASVAVGTAAASPSTPPYLMALPGSARASAASPISLVQSTAQPPSRPPAPAPASGVTNGPGAPASGPVHPLTYRASADSIPSWSTSFTTAMSPRAGLLSAPRHSDTLTTPSERRRLRSWSTVSRAVSPCTRRRCLQPRMVLLVQVIRNPEISSPDRGAEPSTRTPQIRASTTKCRRPREWCRIVVADGPQPHSGTTHAATASVHRTAPPAPRAQHAQHAQREPRAQYARRARRAQREPRAQCAQHAQHARRAQHAQREPLGSSGAWAANVPSTWPPLTMLPAAAVAAASTAASWTSPAVAPAAASCHIASSTGATASPTL